MDKYNEMMTGQAERLSGKPDSSHMEKTIETDTQGMDMKISKGANSTFLNKAVEHLNRETQRGEHAPMVGGYLHDHKMR